MTTLTAEEPVESRTQCTESFMTSWDGAPLCYRAWLPATPTRHAVILFHRGHEHSGRLAELAEALNLYDTSIFAWDQRGHGKSPGERGYADSFTTIVRDIESFVRFISNEHGIAIDDMAVMGHSVGAVAVAAWVHDYAPPVRAMVLVTPAFRIKLYVPLARPALRLRTHFGGRSFVKNYVKAKMLTHDPKEIEAYQNDPLISRSIATNILLEVHDMSTRLLADAGAINTPTLILSAGADWVVKNSAQRRFFDRLSSDVKEMMVYPGFHHAVLHEEGRERPIGRIRHFLSDAFERTASRTFQLNADQSGYTQREYAAMQKPLTKFCPRSIGFRILRAGLGTLCRLSAGVRVGWRTGFDSGQSLDYVYRDQPNGITPLGRFIDRTYLNTIGWRGIRARKTNLREALLETINAVQATGDSVRIVDIASGPGRYLLETLEGLRGQDVRALLRDRSEGGLDEGRQLAAAKSLGNVAYDQGDAFDAASLSTITPRPNIAIVSGLYELFPENEMVLRSLHGLGAVVRPGGYLIYTNQPWHPQVEMIARVLINRDQKPWIMRRRTQAEMDQLVASAGFEKIGMRIDDFGIFTVSVARRIGSTL